MTDRALWTQAQEDYTNALAVAQKAWSSAPLEASVIQAAAATILIHVTKLRERGGVTPQTAPTAVKGDHKPVPSQASGAVPPCPQCGGATKDVRQEKRGEKSPDFTCLQQHGQCGKPSKDGKKWFATAVWVKDIQKGPALAAATQIRNTIDSYAAMPAALQGDAAEDDLPF